MVRPLSSLPVVQKLIKKMLHMFIHLIGREGRCSTIFFSFSGSGQVNGGRVGAGAGLDKQTNIFRRRASFPGQNKAFFSSSPFQSQRRYLLPKKDREKKRPC